MINNNDIVENKYFYKDDTRLTNYFVCDVVVDGIKYMSGEAAYHSQKFIDEDIRKVMSKLTPDESKRCSRVLSRLVRKDWENVKYNLMKKVVKEKFRQNKDCLEELLGTKNLELIEDSTGRHDNIWGYCTCSECRNLEHQNLLGKILMEVRDELK